MASSLGSVVSNMFSVGEASDPNTARSVPPTASRPLPRAAEINPGPGDRPQRRGHR
ncbi:hypothetical protein ABZ540_35160 [Nocardia xishanensis]|uniref:hypothetical protein n=1 Tax=Nocardia xishanensis TaxID=238964 RepID=UPI00340E5E97